ncbi:MAG: hypothetical protein U1F36_10705 [Planctomycetota bacterium]
MTNGGGLAAADKGAKKNDKGAKKGGAAQPCKLAKIVVTVVRKDGAKGDNFFSDVYLEGQAERSGAAVPDKPVEFGGLEPGTYEVSARPAKGSGYSFEKGVRVTVGAGESKDAKIELVPHELVEVRPNSGKSHRQFVNLVKKDDDATWGAEFEVTAHLKKKEAGVTVWWDLEFGKDNGKYLDKVINAKDHRSIVTTKSETDENGVAKATLTLGWFGGNTVKVLAALSEDVTAKASRALKSDEFVVWRKHWYQLSYPKGATLPSRAKLAASFDKVFLASEEVDEKQFDPAVYTADFRPAWQFKPGTGDAKKLCIGTHNIGTYAKLFVDPTKDRKPKSHIILCDWQWDAAVSYTDGSKKAVVTDEAMALFEPGDNPAERKVKMTVTGQANWKVGIFDPPLKAGEKMIVSGQWIQATVDTVSGSMSVTHQGTLQADEIRIDKARGESREVIVKRPNGFCDGASCPCGGPPQKPTVDATNAIAVKFTLSAAHGTYLGWAEKPFHTVVILNMNADDLNDVVNHEIGHLFGQTPPKADNNLGLPLHPKMYQRRGGSGTHCAEGATFTANASESPQLNPATAGQLDAQGNASGSYSGGTCIMFGIGNAGKREFCAHCAAMLKARDMSAFAS